MSNGIRKGSVVEGIVLETRFPNKGIVQVSGDGEEPVKECVTVKNALPHQTVRVRITKKRKGGLQGDLLAVTQPAPFETESDCPHFPACGGCLMRTWPYERQLALKEQQVRQILEEAVGEFPFEGVIPSPDVTEYRNKMEFSFGDSQMGGPLQLGLHRKGSFYDILTVDGCRIVDSDFRTILKEVLGKAESYGLPFYHKVRHDGYLRHLLVRKGRFTGEILAGLVTSGLYPGGDAQEAVFLKDLTDTLTGLKLSGRLTGLVHIRNDNISDTITADSLRVLAGRDFFYEQLENLTFKISPFSFFQTNSAGARVLYEKVCEYASAEKGMRIFDLYSGTGTIAQMLAGVAEHVTGVEIVEEAVLAARENAARNGLTNCDFVAGDVLKVVDELSEKPDMIILDPPRDGVHPKALSKIIAFGVERIVYISCKVSSLARDLPVLEAAGYHIERCCCVDMFPATANIETVCLLSNTQSKKKESYITLDVEMADYYRIKNEGKNSTT